MYKHILLSTELSADSAQVEERAKQIQNLTAAKLSIIHVVEPMPIVYPIGEGAIAYDFRESIKLINKQAKDALLKLKDKLEIPDANIIVKEGHIGDEVLKFSSENNVDLIVTGSHGRHGVRLLLGSTANAILHGAKVDVMAVRIID